MNWPLAALSELCEINIGRTPSRHNPTYWGAEHPWLSIADMNQGAHITHTKEAITQKAVDECNCKLVNPETVLLSFKLSIGKVGITKRPVFTNEAIAALPIKRPEQLEVRYLAHALRSLDLTGGLDRAAKGLTLNKEKIGRIRIALPPLSQQRRVSSILDHVDALRAKRKDALVQLDDLTRSIFREMFGDPPFANSDWPPVSLGEIASTLTGFAFRSEEYVAEAPTAIRLCRGANVLPRRVDWSDTAWWPKEKTRNLEAFQLAIGDIVLAMDRPWIAEGFKIAQICEEDCPSLLVQRVTRIRGSERATATFIFHLLSQPEFARHCKPTETTVPHISPKEIRSYTFRLPPISLQEEFGARMSAVNNLTQKLRRAFAEADSLMSSVQQFAFREEL